MDLISISPEVYVINLVIGIVTFFILRWILKRMIKTSRSLRIASTLIGTIILTPLIYAGLIFCWIAIASYYPERDFDKEKWRTDIEKRYEMTDDLVDNEKLIGKSKKEIKELLGQEEVSMDSSRWTYYIGYKPGVLGIDPDILEIEFKDDKVVKCWTRGT